MVKKNFLFICLACLVLSTVFISCKDEEEDTVTKNYMVGTLMSDIPNYAIKGTTITFTASGITYPEDVEYIWYLIDVYPDSIPFNPVTIKLPDSICTVTGSLIAFPGDAYKDDYYSSTKTFTINVLDTAINQSLKGLKYGGGIVDERDGQYYHTVTIGNLEWFAENLAWAQDGISYGGSDAIDAIFGKYYTWNEATGGVSADGLLNGPQGICPKGWRIPTNEDWTDLASHMSDGKITSFKDNWVGLGEKASVDAYLNDSRMWPYSPDNSHTNTVGFNALPGGNFQYMISIFRNNGEYAFWWSASEKNQDQSYYRYIYYDQGNFPYGATDKSRFAASVRCVRSASDNMWVR